MPRPRRTSDSATPPPPSPGLNTLLVVALICLLVLAVGFLAYSRWQQDHAASTAQNPPSPSTTSPDLITDDRIIYAGMPRPGPNAGPETTFEVLKNIAYISGYSETRKDPLWVAYRLFRTPNPFNLPRPKGGFITDNRTTAHVKDADFARSGYDRGHMAPNSAIARCFGEQAQIETFYLSNICPQAPLLNERDWERLEVDEKKYADTLEEVWVIDGPIFADLNGGTTERLASGIAVPSAFYKILVDEDQGRPRVFSVIMPQSVSGTELPQQFLSSVDEIEKETHLDFFWKLDEATQAQMEQKTWPMW